MPRKAYTILLAAAATLALAAIHEGPAPAWDINLPVINNYAPAEAPAAAEFQVIAFNIERGIHWPDVVKYIEQERARVPATVVLLSECDRNHSRSHDVFVADEMARALKLNLIFVTEYIEYNDQTPENQGDHGNAILSPFPLTDVRVIRHTSIFSWQKWGWLQGQPRFGERVTVGATAHLPGGKLVRFYATHLESDGETIGKWIQLHEIIADLQPSDPPAVIGGDLNELPSGLMFAQLPRYQFQNAFRGDHTPTGGCKPAADGPRCKIKIDWILYRGLQLKDRVVDHPLNAEGGVISDHVPVRAVFQID
jgi:endonuclease/exonuclease/phosphatase family metal-dependent hydrolase